MNSERSPFQKWGIVCANDPVQKGIERYFHKGRGKIKNALYQTVNTNSLRERVLSFAVLYN